MIISLDLDDTLAELLPAWLNAHAEQGGTRIAPTDVGDWGFSCLPAEEHPAFYAVRTPALYQAILPMAGALEGVAALQERGHRLVVVSSDKAPYAAEKRAWLDRWFGPGTLPLVLAQNKWAAVSADVLVDDGPHNQPTILYTRPHNATAVSPRYRALHWSSVVFIVGLIEQRKLRWWPVAEQLGLRP